MLPMCSPFFHTLRSLKIIEDLENRCWEVVEVPTEEAVASDDFVVAERSLVASAVKRERC